MATQITRILVVDDEKAHLALLRRAFARQPDRSSVQLSFVESLQQAREFIASTPPQLVISDLMLPDGQGMELISEDDRYPLVLMTSFGDERVAVEALKSGVRDYVIKSSDSMASIPSVARRVLVEWKHEHDARRAEEALQESEEDFRCLFEATTDLVFVLEGYDVIRKVNQAALQRLEYSEKELLSMGLTGFMSRQGQASFELMVAGLGKRGVLRHELELRSRDGWYIPVECVLASIKVPKGENRRILVSMRDVSGKKKAASRIRDLQERIQRVEREAAMRFQVTNEEIDAFVSSVYGILGSPLRSVEHASKSLAEEHKTEMSLKGREHLAGLRANTERIIDLVEGLGELARFQAGGLAKRDVDLSVLFGQVAEELTNSDPERVVQFDIRPNLTASGDPTLLRRVAEKLLRNAWNSTSHRRAARISFEQASQTVSLRGRQRGMAVYRVQDSGTGFSGEHAEKMFRAFYRVPGSGGQWGVGVGLALVRRIVELHGGRVWAESEEGTGAAVYFTL